MAELPRIKLYTNSICPFAVRAHMALRHRGIPYEIEQVTIPTPDSFKEKNPLGKLPTLEVWFPGKSESIILYESVPLMYFVEELEGAPGPSLLPKCSIQRAFMRIFMELVGNFVTATYAMLRAHKATPEQLEALKKDLDARTNELERHIQTHGSAEGPYIFGAQATMADYHVVPFLSRILAFFPHFRPYEPLTNAPRLRAILAESIKDGKHSDIFLSHEEYVKVYAKYANPEN